MAMVVQVTWQSDPFEVLAVNGYLYGRGVTDNKGPIMAMIFALQVRFINTHRETDSGVSPWRGCAATSASPPAQLLTSVGLVCGSGVCLLVGQELRDSGRLDLNAVLLIEGEEESSSEGFREAVLQNLHWFRGTSLILQANSTWIDDEK